jgi:hypothetical protein
VSILQYHQMPPVYCRLVIAVDLLLDEALVDARHQASKTKEKVANKVCGIL